MSRFEKTEREIEIEKFLESVAEDYGYSTYEEMLENCDYRDMDYETFKATTDVMIEKGRLLMERVDASLS